MYCLYADDDALPLALSGFAHFIIQIDAPIVINCDTIVRIREWVGSSWEYLPGASVIDAFCAIEEPTLVATISLGKVMDNLTWASRFLVSSSDTALFQIAQIALCLGFEGLALDETNSYLEFVARNHTHRIDFNIFPSCPPPVLTVCVFL